MVGVAVKVALVPIHIDVDGEAAIETLEGKFGLTIIVTVFEVAGEPVKHGLAFEVISQVTTSLFANVVEANVAAFVPAFVPLTFHW